MNRRGERGAAGSVLVAGACLAVVSVFLAAGVLIQWFALIRDGEQAAELAALAAVAAAVEGESPCAAAAASGTRNGAAVSGCVVRGSGRHVVVEISVLVALEPSFPGGPREARRTATAGT